MSMGRTLEKKRSWKKRKRLGDHWGLLDCRTPGCVVGAGVLALVGRTSETPGKETWHKGVHDGNCSPGDGDKLQVEGAQSSHDVAAAAVAAVVAGGDGDVLGLVGGQWIGLQ